MPTMRLPDGWTDETSIDVDSVPTMACSDGSRVWINENYVSDDKVPSICVDNYEMETDAPVAPIAVTLALIRSTNLDPVYEAAKRIVALAAESNIHEDLQDDYPEIGDKLDALGELIESLEVTE